MHLSRLDDPMLTLTACFIVFVLILTFRESSLHSLEYGVNDKNLTPLTWQDQSLVSHFICKETESFDTYVSDMEFKCANLYWQFP